MATVWQRGRLIVSCSNLIGYGPMYGSLRGCGFPRGLHAEVRAARLARGKLNRGKPWGISVVRYHADGSRAYSRPCPLCQAYLAGAGCSWVDYYDKSGTVCRMTLD